MSATSPPLGNGEDSPRSVRSVSSESSDSGCSSASSSSSSRSIPEWGEVPLTLSATDDEVIRVDSTEFLGLRGTSQTSSLLSWPEGVVNSSVELSNLSLQRGAISVSSGQKLVLRNCVMGDCRVSVGDGARLVVEGCKWKSGLRPAVHLCWSSTAESVATSPRVEVKDCDFSDMHVAVSLELEAFPTEGDLCSTADIPACAKLSHCRFTDIRGAAIVVAVHIRSSPLAVEQTDISNKPTNYHFNLGTLMAADESSLTFDKCSARFEISFGGSKLLRPFSFSSWPLPAGEYSTPRRGSSVRGAQQVKARVSEDGSRLDIVCPPADSSGRRKKANRRSSSTQISVWMETLGCSDENPHSLSRGTIMSAFRKRSLLVHPDKRGMSPGISSSADSSSPEDFITLVEARDGLLQCVESRRETVKRNRRL
ncbi:hypothetical protein Pmar_PMAR006216 [Perkinsus marinus ATCC 50983]|uniref:Uncharacterized protein n=1 Tax=Perkinsus marinus (strain ATCC 50983 / TXsc) TaxID=423536 RepID=C5LAE9_PERM5|nr:hypothetical protein Pmar_PMAR006216 [Perkinsus marinus ATCC 50983]EER06405.1 hypothetical protein Pmar_PMAR006216 [Perkinsus marinus ATCC 50983]|eukprot:XP_002774589.1 hypothetical protein Pmar_PMAR006216 [Perkinsus marinus ATCC 50983]